MRRKPSEIVTRLTTIAILSALGFILMAFLRISYPLAPWMMIEISDIVVVLSYVLYGFSGSVLVAVLKTLLDISINGLSGFIGIGNITALLTSLTYVIGLYVTSHLLKLFNKKLPHRILGYTIIVLFSTSVLTLANYIFITPTYISGTFATCFSSSTVENILSTLEQMGYSYISYPAFICAIYIPFNLIKGSAICLIYELIFNRLIFVLMQRSPFMKKYFVGSIFDKKKEISEKSDENKE